MGRTSFIPADCREAAAREIDLSYPDDFPPESGA